MSIHDQAYVIQASHYQETSALVKLLTKDNGVVSAIVRGVHQPNKKSNALRAAVQLGNLIECQWSGKASLKTIYQMELLKSSSFDSTEKYICLTYIHELILYFLREEYYVENVFHYYTMLLEKLIAGNIEQGLRVFEGNLLEAIGYGIDFGREVTTDKPVVMDGKYRVLPGIGVSLADAVDVQVFSGAELLSIQRQEYTTPALLSAAKKINRVLLAYHMEGKPIKARLLYQQLFSE